MSTCLQPCGLQPARLLHPWDFPGTNTGGVPFPSPGGLPNPGIEPGSPALRADSLLSEPPGMIIEHVLIVFYLGNIALLLS